MSAADVFMSSPPRPAKLDPYSVAPSSPDLPSLGEFFSRSPKKPLLKSGSNAAVIPVDARSTFTSAATLLREAPEIDIETEKVTKSPSRKPQAGRGRSKKAATSEESQVQNEAAILIDSSPQEKPWQKYRSRKPTPEDGQQPMQKGRVTKATVKDNGGAKVKKGRTKAETVSRHFAATEDQLPKEANMLSDSGWNSQPGATGVIARDTAKLPSCSEPALRRRVDWTPPPNDSAVAIPSDSDNQELLSSIDGTVTSKKVFQSLFDNYGHKDEIAVIPSGQEQQAEILKKRKRIELVSTKIDQNNTPKENSPSKAATTKKKTRTITELATAPYSIPEPVFDLSARSTRDSLLNYLDSGSEVKALVEHQSAVMSNAKEAGKPSKPKAKPRRKKKTGTAEDPILLSPNSALKQSSNQDFVFGTSSQLVREDSPTTLRELQLAIQASNQEDDPFGEADSQGLWHASARDNDGDLLEVEVVDLVRTPALLSRHERDSAPTSDISNSKEQPQSDDFVDIDTIDFESPQTQSAVPGPQNSHFFQSQGGPARQSSSSSNSSATPTSTGETSISRPNYESFTDSQLSKQITSYGFKPVKKRQAMIALLDQCWASKNSANGSAPTRSMSTTANMCSPKKKQAVPSAKEKPATEKPAKRPRGRPKKTPETAPSPAAPAAIPTTAASPKNPRSRPKQSSRKTKEIADSDLDDDVLSPSPKSSPDRVFSSPPPLDLSTTDEADMSLTLSPTDQQASLFKHITKAVTSAPRSQDPSKPSWYEKMLLYDPIVLEEFAAWLNAGELTKTGFDGEVSPFDVKKWCESKSVICLWRQNLRGKDRKRY